MASSQNLGYPAYVDGMAWSSLLSRQLAGGVAVWDTNASATAVNPRGGVLQGPANPLGVAPLATPGMSVLVNAGYCAVPHPTQGHGVYLFGLLAQGTLTVAANGTGSARTDIVIARVYDLGTASSYCDVEIISGTPGSGQPATPGVSLLLGTVTVAPSATSITAGNITDQRTFTVAPGGILPTTTAAAPPLAQGQIMLNTATGGLETLAPPVTYTVTITTTTDWVSPFTGNVYASLIGGGAGGGGGFQDNNGNGNTQGGSGGGGGEFVAGPVAVTVGHSYPISIGEGGFRGDGGSNAAGTSAPTAGAPGTVTTFTGDTVTLTANGGLAGGEAQTSHPDDGGLGGSGSIAAVEQPGGAGGPGAWAHSATGGGGGGSGSAGAPGGAGHQSGAGGAAGPGGGAGGAGGKYYDDGASGTAPGGGGGGGGADNWTYWQAGGDGANGQVTLTWTIQPAALTPVVTTITSTTSTPHEYLNLVNTDQGTGLNTGYRSGYGWGIGYGRGDGSLNCDGYLLPEIQVTFTADGRTDYQIDARWGLAVPEAAVDGTSPSIPKGQCRIVVTVDGRILDQVFLRCAASGGITQPGDSGSFTVYTSSQNGTTPSAGSHTVALAVWTVNTLSGRYSGAHVGDLASVGTSAHPFGGALRSGVHGGAGGRAKLSAGGRDQRERNVSRLSGKFGQANSPNTSRAAAS